MNTNALIESKSGESFGVMEEVEGMSQSVNEKVAINLTIPDFVYEKLKKEADQAGISLNQLVINYIQSISY